MWIWKKEYNRLFIRVGVGILIRAWTVWLAELGLRLGNL